MYQSTTSRKTPGPEYQRSMLHDPNKTQEKTNREFYQSEDRCRSALKQLGKSMGYNLTGSSTTDRKLVLADAISTLEKLRFGERITRRPRELEEHKIMTILQDLIPESYAVNIFMRADATEAEIARAELAEVMTAAGGFIDELKRRGGEVVQKPMAVTGARALCKQPIPGPNIETVLEKMEKWCDAWLNGDLNDEEWESFENCLDK